MLKDYNDERLAHSFFVQLLNIYTENLSDIFSNHWGDLLLQQQLIE